MDQKVINRFNKKWIPEPNSGCWLWTAGTRGSRGSNYASFHFLGKHESGHRVSWILFRGAIPNGLMILHKCSVMLCVNPDHLYVGTAKDNMRDVLVAGHNYQKNKTHCPKGHEYSADNIYSSKGRNMRMCGICCREKRTERYQENVEASCEKAREYYQKNKSHRSAYALAWTRKNRERINARRKELAALRKESLDGG